MSRIMRSYRLNKETDDNIKKLAKFYKKHLGLARMSESDLISILVQREIVKHGMDQEQSNQ